ncbi:MAG: ArsR/SmtB family transcription factor [Fimbriimonas sp.]
MPNESELLDRVFQALSNPTRRDVLARLGRGPASMTELAESHEMALPSFLQHLQVLERSGMVSSQKVGRVRTYRLEPQPLLLAEHWMDVRRNEWETRLDQLDDLLYKLKENP